MKIAYPVFIKEVNKEYLVFVPDMDLYTEGENIIDASEKAKEVILLEGTHPQPSDFKEAINIAKQKAKTGMDYSDGLLTFVIVDFSDDSTVSRHAVTDAADDMKALKKEIDILSGEQKTKAKEYNTAIENCLYILKKHTGID